MRFEHVILWHVYPLGFTGAERDNPPGGPVRHRLPQLLAWLDHLVALGANGLQLGPVFDSETHGYDTRDHFRIDPRLGDDGDLDALVAAAHARGVRVVLDGVFNHVGRSFPRFAAAEAGDAESARWFRRDGEGWADFEGHGALVALNHEEPAVLDHVVAVMRHWLDRGIDGWRLDAAYAVPTAFWRRVADQVRASHPDAWLLGEVIHGDYAAFVAESGLDSVTQYELWKAIWSSLNERNLWELAWSLGRHRDMVAAFLPATFVGNHDTTRIASRLDDERHLAHALTVLFTVGGIPVVYAGDEEGFRGVKEDREGGDDAVRPRFPDSPDELSPVGEPILRLHQRLIALRRRKPWLAQGRYEQVRVENDVLVYRMSAPDGGDAVTVALNVGDAAVDLAPGPGERVLEGGLGPHEAAVIGRD
ncbi:alpha-amylase family glycosyl hydrolase [Amnibacterium kyonggiense]|uniref:Glycosidase n=1 Tax=Amnibacterium kyonggiense TaxID=595671 RepID=A0A4R7FQC3_9MICO|nr:alpha-amylase family glycosyl hydrolase [Amnibacterium kyonggiense]TDS79972.1 glycosidase [Amnibacterium kyonggiense]